MYRSFSYGKTGRLSTIKSKDYRDWQARALGLISSQRWRPVEGPFGLRIELPKGTRQDLDNTVKATADVLRAAGVIVDDSPKYMRRLEVFIGGNDFTTLTITPLEDDNDLDRSGTERAL